MRIDLPATTLALEKGPKDSMNRTEKHNFQCVLNAPSHFRSTSASAPGIGIHNASGIRWTQGSRVNDPNLGNSRAYGANMHHGDGIAKLYEGMAKRPAMDS